jgi:alkylation response protein AidB-like acyl-CoA dehydrogenase
MTIDLDLSPDQRQIVQSIDDVLADKFPLARFRQARGGDHDHAALPALAALGWLGLGVAERHGGAGLGPVEEVLLHRALGRHLVSPGVLASALAVHLALAVGNTGLAGDIMAGKTRACLASSRRGSTRDGAAASVAIIDAREAESCVFWNAALIACMPLAQLGAPRPAHSMDRTVALQHATLAAAGNLVLTGDAGAALRRRADLLVAAQLLGIAEAALDLAVEYAKLRQQFGQPIGAFQAIKHRCADMKLRTKTLNALVLMAALAEQAGQSDATVQVAAARLLASRYALDNAAAGIQIHGAMGFTAECDAHLFLLRAHLLENLGSNAAEREIAMASLPLDSPDPPRSPAR